MRFWEWFELVFGVIVEGDECVRPAHRYFVSLLDFPIVLIEDMPDFLVGLVDRVSNANCQILAFQFLYSELEWGLGD
jgi:hypothetical protein